MRLLLVDTSTSTCSVAVTAGERILAEELVSSDRPLSSRIIGSVDAVLRASELAFADIDAIGVSLGPGSFTGLRVGVAAVKGLAASTGKRAVGFSSLRMLAMNVPWACYPICPMFDARKKEVYAGLYRWAGVVTEPVVADCVMAPEHFLPMVDGPVIFVGEGALRYREMIVSVKGDDALFAPDHAHQPRASAGSILTRLALENGATPLHLLNPAYIRKSEAELAKLTKKNNSIL